MLFHQSIDCGLSSSTNHQHLHTDQNRSISIDIESDVRDSKFHWYANWHKQICQFITISLLTTKVLWGKWFIMLSTKRKFMRLESISTAQRSMCVCVLAIRLAPQPQRFQLNHKSNKQTICTSRTSDRISYFHSLVSFN